MIEAIISWLSLIVYLFTKNVDYLKVSGIFAIAGNLYGLRQELKEKYKIGE